MFEVHEFDGGKMVPVGQRKLDPTKLDWHVLPHSNSSQLCRGVYPEGMTKEQIEPHVKGSFGGRFTAFGGGKFEYVAYTD